MPGQLRMKRDDYDGLPEVAMPDGYTLRAYQPGDEPHWANVINSVGDLGKWDVDRVYSGLTQTDRFQPSGLFFAVKDDTPVATACAYPERAGDKSVGQLHMVGVDPAHQGKRLGFWVSLAVVEWYRDNGFERVYLLTDDFRLAAVKTYLNMGFKPDFRDDDHEGRWKKLYETLKIKP
ncbi:MAG: GNAT family N-acetyltransferase [Candidatus Poribacteria bacterium]|nr:GNAT family N-acetyltransferase [Candidatus Poribacteria bacterium]